MSPVQVSEFFAFVTRLVPSDPPVWLARYLLWQGQDIRAAIWFEDKRKSRGRTLRCLKALLASPTAKNMRALKAILNCAPFELPLYILDTQDKLIAEGCRIVKLLTAEDGRATYGRGKKLSDDEPHSKTLCAGLLLEVIHSLHSKMSGCERSRFAQQYYDLLCRWAGVKPKSSNDNFSAWRPHFEKKQETPILQARRRSWKITLDQAIAKGRIPYSLLDLPLTFFVKPTDPEQRHFNNIA